MLAFSANGYPEQPLVDCSNHYCLHDNSKFVKIDETSMRLKGIPAGSVRILRRASAFQICVMQAGYTCSRAYVYFPFIDDDKYLLNPLHAAQAFSQAFPHFQ